MFGVYVWRKVYFLYSVVTVVEKAVQTVFPTTVIHAALWEHIYLYMYYLFFLATLGRYLSWQVIQMIYTEV